MPNLSRFGGWALITGAARGLGKAFAEELSKDGVPCFLVDRDGPPIDSLAVQLEKTYGVPCQSIRQDLTEPDAVDKVAAYVGDRPIGLLVNNAGVACGGAFATRDLDALNRVVLLNCLAPVALTRAFLPPMLERKHGGIIIVASLMSFLSAPNEAVYCGSKAFNLHFGEALWGETRGTGVDVITVCPAGMRTEFFARDGIHADDCARLMKVSAPPERIARMTLRRLGRKPTFMPPGAWILGNLPRLVPRWVAIRMVGGLMRRLARYV